MKRREIFFAAAAVLLLGFLLCGCMTGRKATMYFDSHSLEAAKYFNSRFPTKDSVGTPTVVDSGYTPDYSGQIDSLHHVIQDQVDAFKKAKEDQKADTSCLTTIKELEHQNSNLAAAFTAFKNSIKPPKPKIIEVPHYISNPAKDSIIAGQDRQIIGLNVKLQIANDKASHRGKMFWFLIAGIVLYIAIRLFIKSKMDVINTVLNQVKNKFKL